jgi:hypothetical protein
MEPCDNLIRSAPAAPPWDFAPGVVFATLRAAPPLRGAGLGELSVVEVSPPRLARLSHGCTTNQKYEELLTF